MGLITHKFQETFSIKLFLSLNNLKNFSSCHIPTLTSDLFYSLISQTSRQTVLFWITTLTPQFHLQVYGLFSTGASISTATSSVPFEASTLSTTTKFDSFHLVIYTLIYKVGLINWLSSKNYPLQSCPERLSPFIHRVYCKHNSENYLLKTIMVGQSFTSYHPRLDVPFIKRVSAFTSYSIQQF